MADELENHLLLCEKTDKLVTGTIFEDAEPKVDTRGCDVARAWLRLSNEGEESFAQEALLHSDCRSQRSRTEPVRHGFVSWVVLNGSKKDNGLNERQRTQC